jgi:N-acetylmuramidase/Putative peptidoglycan binding domain
MQATGLAEPLTAEGLSEAGGIVGAGVVELWSVISVETSGRGFLADRRPVILFERHEFRRRTGGRFDATHPEISGPPGGYGPSGAHQHIRLAEAIGCDRKAALESTSWGLGQIMGYNASAAGFADVEAMVAHMQQAEDAQIAGMAHFICADRLDGFLRQHDWPGFARRYNGPGYAGNAYDTKLAQAYARFSRTGLPDLRLRAVQLLLTYQGLDPGPVDGLWGGRTATAVSTFRARHGLAQTGPIDDALFTALRTPAVAPKEVVS